MFILSIVLITLALVFYTIGVWSERIQGELKWWQVGAFALGFAADTSGTLLMSAIARSDGPSGLEGSPILAQHVGVPCLDLQGTRRAAPSRPRSNKRRDCRGPLCFCGHGEDRLEQYIRQTRCAVEDGCGCSGTHRRHSGGVSSTFRLM